MQAEGERAKLMVSSFLPSKKRRNVPTRDYL